MNRLLPLKLFSYSGLACILISALLVFYQQLTLDEFKSWALAGTLIWIATAPFWINKKPVEGAE
ncbi:hypothetical protein L1F30_01960 [Simiduia sp. 21SJ11W-1]|uniref:hypothetical protein n=1 Tax=Simiduia sp. 21SJ11W-1 TaxID=2909669 RepID=UPI00209DEE95|nr:hypothetical protein [Simiduia sp. 21SJ11W-1]UTA48320.1 hypothetical protein L1F30_01960 [Simiduia sp. 21SJ11W-1]